MFDGSPANMYRYPQGDACNLIRYMTKTCLVKAVALQYMYLRRGVLKLSGPILKQNLELTPDFSPLTMNTYCDCYLLKDISLIHVTVHLLVHGGKEQCAIMLVYWAQVPYPSSERHLPQEGSNKEVRLSRLVVDKGKRWRLSGRWWE